MRRITGLGQLPRLLFVASVLAVVALASTAGAALAGPGEANGHAGQSKLRLTPAAAPPSAAPARECGGKSCLKLSFSAGYDYTPAAGGRTCPEWLVLTWDGKAIGATAIEGKHGSCVATLRRDVVAPDVAHAALSVGGHTVCALASGGPPTSSANSCAVFTVAARPPLPTPPATPAPTGTPNNGVHPTASPTRQAGSGNKNAIVVPAPSTQPTQPNEAPAPVTPAPSEPAAIPIATPNLPAATPGGAAVVVLPPTVPAPSAEPIVTEANKSGGTDVALLTALVALVLGLAVVDVAYVAAAARGAGRFR